MDASTFKSAIHAVSSALEIPSIILLMVMVVIVVFQLGGVLVEYFGSRFAKRLSVKGLLDELAGKTPRDMQETIQRHPVQRAQKTATIALLENLPAEEEARRILAAQLLSDEESRLARRVNVTDVIARIAPMFGLMATLIPLGPGLIALGQGDTKNLADSLLTAFDATVAGLAAAGVAFIISKVRKRWYQDDLTAMQSVLEEVIR